MEKKLFNNTKIKTDNTVMWCLTHSDTLHPRLNSILGIFLYNIDSHEYSYINFSHPDLEKLNKSYYLDKILLSSSSFVFSKKEIMHMHECNGIDLDSLYFLEKSTEIPYDNFKTNAHIFFERKYDTNKINNIIPITKHLECFKKMVEFIVPFVSNEVNDFYQDKVNSIVYELEKNSIKINRRKFDVHFELDYEKNNFKENQLYPYYNPFSTTGRFICSYNGLGLQTLNKENGSKEAFIPNNDLFVEIDYDGYHIRLIGELIGYEFKTENVHKYLTQYYFEEINEENIKKSKDLTFQQLYGGIFAKYMHIEFFKKTQEYVDLIWKLFQTQGYIETPIAKRKIKQENIKECTPQKLLNYLIQAYETERNTLIMEKIFVYLKPYKTQMCLYVYDAFVLDMLETEATILNDIKDIFSENGKFPVKVKKSNTLNNFKQF